MRWSTAPRWAIIAVIAVSVLVVFWVVRLSKSDNGSGSTDTKRWCKDATKWLTDQGYSETDASNAVNAYAGGSSLTPGQVSLVAGAIGSVGMPQSVTPNSAVQAQIANAPATGPQLLGGGTSNPPGAPYPANTSSASAYWNIKAGAAGWSTTFYGISDQFFGNTSHAAAIQKANPNLAATLWGKIPQGSLVKVQRPDDQS